MHEHRSTGVALSPQHLCCKAHTPLSPPPSQERAKPPNIHSYFAPLHTPQSFRGPCHSTRTADRVVELCSQSFSANPTACMTGGSGCHSLPHLCTSSSAIRDTVPSPCVLAHLVLHTERLLLTGLFPSPVTLCGCVCTRTARRGQAGCSNVLIIIRAQEQAALF